MGSCKKPDKPCFMKIICVGRNYADHARELGNALPEAPVLFLKPSSSLLLPGKDLYYPEFTKDLHYEAELVFRIGKNGKYIAEKFASRYLSAVSVGIDFTARDIQDRQKEKGLPWEIAKAFDGSAAVGRFFPLTPDDVMNEWSFALWKNGMPVQQGDSSEMVFSPAAILSYASRFFTLNTGDLLFTGTPAGVGPVQPGDRLEAMLQDEKVLEINIR